MDVGEYRKRVIDLFRGGRATDEQWEEMAWIILYASEDGKSPCIDETVDPDEGVHLLERGQS